MRGELDDESPFATDARTLVSLGIIILVGAVASSSGVGGGAIFIPLLNALVGFNLKSSTSLSQACITCGAAAALLANLMHHHPKDPRVALVDFTLAAVLTPILLMGVGVGVLLNVMFPAWLLTGLLLLLLSLLIAQSVNKGRALWLQENVLRSCHQHPAHSQLEKQRLDEDPTIRYKGVSLLAEEKQWRQRRRRWQERFPGASGRSGGEEADAATIREPLLLDPGNFALSPAHLASPQRCLTPAPTAIWHMSDFGAVEECERTCEGPGDMRAEESAAPAALERLCLKGDDKAADCRERLSGPTGFEACVRVPASIFLPGGVETKSPGPVVTEQQIAATGFSYVEIISEDGGGVAAPAVLAEMATATATGAPAGPTDQLLCDNSGGGGGSGGGGWGVEPVSAAVTAGPSVTADVRGDAQVPPRVSPPLPLPPSPQQQELPTHGPSGRAPSAVSKSPFRRQSVPRSASSDDTMGAASATAPTPSAVAPIANGPMEPHRIGTEEVPTSAPGFHALMPGAPLRREVGGGSSALAATQLSPEAAAAFAEALVTALAAAAASSSSNSGTTWSSSWVAAVTSLLALTAPSWRAFNELGAVDEDEDDGTGAGNIHKARVHEHHSANALLQPDSEDGTRPETELDGSSTRHNTKAVVRRSGGVIDGGKPVPPPLQSVEVDAGGGKCGSGSNGSENASPRERIILGRLRGLPGPQLGASGRRASYSAISHLAGNKASTATDRRKSLGAAAAAATVSVAAAGALLERPLVDDVVANRGGEGGAGAVHCGGGDGGGVHRALSFPLPSSGDTPPKCRNGSRPGMQGSPTGLTAVDGAPLSPQFEMTDSAAATGRSDVPSSGWTHEKGLGAAELRDRDSELRKKQQQQEEEDELHRLLPLSSLAGPGFTGLANVDDAAVIREAVGCGGSSEEGLLLPITSPTIATSSDFQLRDQGAAYQTGGTLFGSLVVALLRIPPTPVMALVVAWGVYFALQFLRSRLVVCTPLWWALEAAQALGMGGLSVGALLVAAVAAAPASVSIASASTFTTFKSQMPSATTPTAATSTFFASTVVATALPANPDWQRQQLAGVLKAPVAVLSGTCAAGLAGGLLGLGGGMVMGPLLLHLGVHPQVTAATSGAMVLFSSSAALVQFALMDRLNIAYAAVFGAASAAASIVGTQVLSRLVRRSGRPSVVVLALAAVMTIGAACVAASGLRTALENAWSGGEGAPGGLAVLCGRQ